MTVVVGQEKKLWKWKCPVANFAYIESLSYNTKEKTIVECSSDNLLKGSEIVALFFFEVRLFLFREWKLNICDEIQNILHVNAHFYFIPKVKINTMLSIYCVTIDHFSNSKSCKYRHKNENSVLQQHACFFLLRWEGFTRGLN